MKKLILPFWVALLLVCSNAFSNNATSQNMPGKNVVNFDWFEYQGKDTVFEQALQKNHYFNPIIAGFYPDPSMIRVENDYYLVNSSFAYFPGLPIFHSVDLVNWQQIGNALDRRTQLTFENGQGISRGIFAPTLRYHNGLFYIITTDVDGIGNFYITAKDPAGPWSDPVALPEIQGIDPDIFFDDDGRVYIAHNGEPEGEALYDGHRAIWLWEFDLKKQKVIADSGRVIVNGGVDLSKKPIWIEAPHIYKVGEWYYLSCAEGGTADQHSQVVFRTKDLHGTFIPYDKNPILTQRDLSPSRDAPVTSTGHADFVQTPAGDWWAVFLGVRPYFDRETNSWYHNTGRETFMLPVHWQDGWPIILPAKTALPRQVVAPALDKPAETPFPPQTGNFTWRDEFNKPQLDFGWLKVRSSAEQWHSVDTKQSTLSLTARQIRLSEKKQASYLGRRQQHLQFVATTRVHAPQSEEISAGLVLFQNAEFHYFLGLKKQGASYLLFLEEVLNGQSKIIHERQLKINASDNSTPHSLVLGLRQEEARLEFFYLNDKGEEALLAGNIDARNLSTQIAGGFVGASVGIHARLDSN